MFNNNQVMLKPFTLLFLIISLFGFASSDFTGRFLRKRFGGDIDMIFEAIKVKWYDQIRKEGGKIQIFRKKTVGRVKISFSK